MNNVRICPYCNAEIEINHDGGYGYEEGQTYQQECSKCGKTFVYETYVSYSYTLEKAECLNDGEHDYQETCTYPKVFGRMRCTMCGDEIPLPEDKYEEYIKEEGWEK
jgi:hypothetical protein